MLPSPRDLLNNDSDPILETIRDMSGAVEATARRVAQTTSFANENGINVIAGQGDLFDDSGTAPFTGTAMVYPPYVDASGNEWHFLGINNGVLQFAVSATNGKAYAGAGGVMLDVDGITLDVSAGDSSYIKYVYSDGTQVAALGTAFSLGATSDVSLDILSRWLTSGGNDVSNITLRATLDGTTGPQIKITNNASGGKSIVINEDSEDVDFRVESNGNANMIIVDGGLDAVGIGGAAESGIELKVTGDAKTTGNTTVGGFLGFGAQTTLTIATDAITATRSNHYVDTEASAATDNLATINGGSEGDILILGTVNSGRDVVVKDGTGNLRLAGGDFTLDNTDDRIGLIKITGSVWVELFRSNNS